MNTTHLADQREQKDEFFRSHPHSPLTPAQQSAFDGLRYYDPDPDLVLHVEVEPFEDHPQMLMKTNRDELRPFFKHGRFPVTVAGETAHLTVYRSPDGHFFLPFVDANAGTETYPAGRYLDLQPNSDGTFVVDFNLAYNPYCAYNALYVCPITPSENRIDIAIRAGEMLPEGEWVDKA